MYKELPKTNCGQCGHSTCMAFAVAVNKGDDRVQACPYISSEKAEALGKLVKIVDWRENIIKQLIEDIKNIDICKMAEDLGAIIKKNRAIEIRCIGRDYIISEDRQISADGKVSPWEKILLLLYIKTGGSGVLTNEWVSFAELKGGGVKVEAIIKECEAPLSEMFSKNAKAAAGAIEKLGAKQIDFQASQHTWIFYLLPKIPILILYWPANDEFQASVKLLFDRTADRFLDVESIVFLCENFTDVIERACLLY